jgi:hypothetical protein
MSRKNELTSSSSATSFRDCQLEIIPRVWRGFSQPFSPLDLHAVERRFSLSLLGLPSFETTISRLATLVFVELHLEFDILSFNCLLLSAFADF